MTPWSLLIKTVGSQESSSTDRRDGNFRVSVSPDDSLTSLHSRIEDVTGLKASQQRLIYRGRIINHHDTNKPHHHHQTNASSQQQPQESSPSPSSPPSQQQQQVGDENNFETAVEKKIRDVVGLSDGHTIHLVPKPASASTSSSSSFSSEEGNSTGTSTSTGAGTSTNEPQAEELSGTASLLAALLGLGTDNDDDDDDNNNSSNNEQESSLPETASSRRGPPSATTVRRFPRSTTSRRTTRRPMNYRLTADDPISPEPGSMEPVRQGLMTLCTMADSLRASTTTTSSTEEELNEEYIMMKEQQQQQQQQHENGTEEETCYKNNSNTSGHPLDANRTWYRGQWIDCLDTINQWLEATVVDIVRVEDVLPSRKKKSSSRHHQHRRRRRNKKRSPPVTDPAVSANDFDGRRRLLLEPCDPNDDDDDCCDINNTANNMNEESQHEEVVAGFRERDNNDGVQLLLIHYNGWPHRWDEWIRSDSERIRPFRTRTRHSLSSPYMSPSPQSVFHAAPSTYIKDEDDKADRSALLPELHRALSTVNSLLAEAIPSNMRQSNINEISSSPLPQATSDLPWLDHSRGVVAENNNNNNNNNGHEDMPLLMDDDELYEDILHLNRDSYTSATATGGAERNKQNSQQPSRRQLESLAPLIDRLGRTLTDAAPHVAALAASMPEEKSPLTDASKSHTQEEDVNTQQDDNISSSSGSGGLLSLLSRESRRRTRLSNNNGEESASTSASSGGLGSAADDEDRINPDHVDFVNGMVNTFRGEDRNTRRERSEDGTSLLGAYLAAASLSNLANGGGSGGSDNNDAGTPVSGVRLRPGNGGSGSTGGGGGGGIDIHIHAIVTGPGVGPNGMGLAMLGGGGGGGLTTASPLRSPTITRNSEAIPPLTPITPPSDNNDDMDLFSDLYSENPQPVDPHGTSALNNNENENDTAEEAAAVAEEEENTEITTSGDAADDTVNPNSLQLNTINSSSSHSGITSPERASTPNRNGSSTRRGPVRRLFRRLGRRSSSSNQNRSNSRHGV